MWWKASMFQAAVDANSRELFAQVNVAACTNDRITEQLEKFLAWPAHSQALHVRSCSCAEGYAPERAAL